jgi:hypothetical protein
MAQSTLDNGGKWKQLGIKLCLEAHEFVDNKIYGIVEVHPETSRALIKEFEVNTLTSMNVPIRSIAACFTIVAY